MKERWSSSRIDPRLTFKIDCRGSLPRPSQPIIQWTPLLFLRWQQISSRKDWHNDVSAFCLAIHQARVEQDSCSFINHVVHPSISWRFCRWIQHWSCFNENSCSENLSNVFRHCHKKGGENLECAVLNKRSLAVDGNFWVDSTT